MQTHEERQNGRPLRIFFVSPYLHCMNVMRRIAGLRTAGVDVSGIAFERNVNRHVTPLAGFASIGQIMNGSFYRRLTVLASALPGALRYSTRLRSADILYCRNLDMALFGLMLCLLSGARTNLVYEVIDIHPLLGRTDWIGHTFRWLERRVLGQTSLLVTSSERFITDYFRSQQHYQGSYHVIENKISASLAAKATQRTAANPPPLVIGIFGKLRCAYSLTVLEYVASRFPALVKIRIGGIPTKRTNACFDKILSLPNVEYIGPYKYPDDLSQIYEGVHLNWCIDRSDIFNARLLLPNRIYEGGAYGVPAIGESGTATGDKVAQQGLGRVIAAPLEQSLSRLIETIETESLARMMKEISTKPKSLFIDLDDHLDLARKMEAMTTL